MIAELLRYLAVIPMDAVLCYQVREIAELWGDLAGGRQRQPGIDSPRERGDELPAVPKPGKLIPQPRRSAIDDLLDGKGLEWIAGEEPPYLQSLENKIGVRCQYAHRV